MVRDMVDVTIRGTAGAIEHPAEAVDLFLKTFARYQPEGAADEWRVYLKSWSPESLKHPELEFLEKARVRILESLLIRGRQLPHEFQPGSLFTNRFVPDIPAKPAPFWFRGEEWGSCWSETWLALPGSAHHRGSAVKISAASAGNVHGFQAFFPVQRQGHIISRVALPEFLVKLSP